MPPLSWNEIRKRAVEFADEYKDATRENAETQSFYNDFFSVFDTGCGRVEYLFGLYQQLKPLS